MRVPRLVSASARHEKDEVGAWIVERRADELSRQGDEVWHGHVDHRLVTVPGAGVREHRAT